MTAPVRKSRLSLEKLVALPIHFMPRPSPDDRFLSYISNKTGRMELHLLNLETRENSQLSHGELPVTPRTRYIWSPGNDYILFSKDPIPGNEKMNIHKITVDEGKVIQLTDTPESRDVLGKMTSDGKWIVFFSDRTERITQLFRMRPDGSEVTQLTYHSKPVLEWSNCYLSSDDKIVYTVNETQNLQNLDIWIVNIDGTERKKLISIKEGSKDQVKFWSKDRKMIAFDSDFKGVQQTGIYFFETQEIKWFGSGKYEEEATQIANDGCQLIALRAVDAEMKVISYDISTGEEISVELPPGFAATIYAIKDSRVLIVVQTDSTHRTRTLLYNLEKKTYEEAIPAEYGDFRPDDFYPDEYITYPSTDGVNVPAIIYKPKDVQSGEKLPAIVIPHGGPTGHYMRTFMEQSQVLVDNGGYVLLMPNVRGSTGYGVEWRDACKKDWGGKDLEDIEKGVEYLQSLDCVDPSRIGIYGGSYGGYLTYLAVTKKPHLWKAASAYVGISSIEKLYEGNKKSFPALTHYLEEQMGKPDTEEIRKLWYDRSAINFVEKMTAKLQIIHTENDPRCPLEQAEIFKDRLLELGREEGKDFEYIILTDRGHGSAGIDQKLEFFNYLLAFFNQNL